MKKYQKDFLIGLALLLWLPLGLVKLVVDNLKEFGKTIEGLIK